MCDDLTRYKDLSDLTTQLLNSSMYVDALEVLTTLIDDWPICRHDNELGKALIYIKLGRLDEAQAVLSQCEKYIFEYYEALKILQRDASCG